MADESSKSYYDILGIKSDATENEIKKAYKKLAVRWHPDKNLDNKELAEKKFSSISNAYHILSDPEKRKKYDMYGKDFDQGGPGIDPNDLFSAFFSGRQGGSRPSGFTFVGSDDVFGNNFPFGNNFGGFGSKSFNFGRPNMYAKTKKQSYNQNQNQTITPTEKELPCTLKDFWVGAVKKLKIKRNNHATQQISEEIINVEIKPGYKEGTKITFNGMGDINVYGKSADLIFVLKEIPHEQFQRVGNDLRYTAEITSTEAISGTTITITNLNGEVIKAKINPLEHSKSTHVIKNAGFPIRQKGQVSGNGDLIIDFKIKFTKGKK